MSGHSKWANIKHKKEAADKVKGKAFSRIAKEIMVAAKMGGADPDANPRLRSALTSAKAVNMPNANIERAIKKGVGELGDAVFEEIVYEGYAPGGVAVMVECLTDNKNRSISDVRMVFDRNNGNMAGSGAVARMFRRQAHFVITGDWADEEKLMDVVLDAGANDLTVEDGVAEVWADPELFEGLVKLFEEKGIPTEEAELIRRPDMVTEITDPAIARQVLRLVERMEELDERVSNTRDSLDGLKESIGDTFGSMESSVANLDRLQGELDGAFDSTGKVKEGCEALANSILYQLNEAMGTEYSLTADGFIQDNDGIIQSLDQVNGSIDEYVQKLKQKSISEAAASQYADAVQAQAEAQDNLNTAYQEYLDAITQYKDVAGGSDTAAYDQARENLERTKQTLQETSQAVEEAEANVSGLDEVMNLLGAWRGNSGKRTESR